MNPDDVPVVFAQATVQTAVTTFLMASMKAQDPELGSGYAQLFCFLASESLRAELDHAPVTTAQLIQDFHSRLGTGVPEDLRVEFTSLSPDQFDQTWSALRERASQDQVDLEELADALLHINDVMSFFASMQGGAETEP